MSKKALLIICDGWGIGDKGKDDVIFNTPTPYWDELLKTYPASQLQASGENVGLPDGQMGNSEVGHLNIGAGRIVYQDLVKINIACRENTIMENPEIKRAYSYAKENNKQIHFMGLVSDGGVHSSLEHLLKLTDIAKEYGLYPSLQNNDEYKAKEWEIASAKYGDEFSHLQDRAEKLAESETDRATYQAMEALIHNLNTMNSRAGAQNPFSSINYGTDTSPEGRMVIKNVMLAEEHGLGNGETPIFPIHIFKVKEGVNYNPGDPNYDLFKLAIRVSAKRMFPNFSFIDAPFNLQYYKPGDYHTEAAYMGCRTRVIGNIYDPSREIVTGRGNLSFTTINLPRLAIEAHGDIDKFYASLDEMMDLVVDQLLARFRIQCSKHVRNYPVLMG